MRPNGTHWRHARAKLDLSTAEAADELGIKQRSLLNIESEQPRAVVSERLAYRAARLYGVELGYLVADDEGVPDQPPAQPPNEPTAPPRRRNGSEDHRGPTPNRRPRPAEQRVSA